MSNLEPVDESFFASAPSRYSQTWSINRPAAEVWAKLTDENPLHWCRGLSIGWTSQRPLSVGTTRKAKVLGGAVALDEHFFIWENERRYAFYVTKTNVPLFRSFAEDYVIEPDGDGRCRFTWTIALAPTALGTLGGPVNKRLFGRFFADTGKYFDAT